MPEPESVGPSSPSSPVPAPSTPTSADAQVAPAGTGASPAIGDNSAAAASKSPPQKPAETPAKPSDPAIQFQSVLIGGGVWAFFGVIIARSANESAKAWIDAYWPFLVAGYVVLIGGYFLWSAWKKKPFHVSEIAKNAAIVFGGIPLIVGGIITISLAPPQYGFFAIHAIFILCVCLLPGAMYYVFIVTRKPSILNKYVANLARLGVLSMRLREKENERLRRRRIESYFQRFEALYGPLANRDDFLDEMCSVNAGDETAMPPVAGTAPVDASKASGFGAIFPPSVAALILLTTVLTAIGFLMVLMPKWSSLFVQANYVSIAPAPDVFIPEFTPVNMAFLGAYFFNIQMLFHRFLRRDLSVNAYVSSSLRMVMAVIGAWVLAVMWGWWFVESDSGFTFISLLSKGFETLPKGDWPLLVLAFVVGVFPRTLWQLIEAFLKKIPGVSILLPSVESDQGLSELDGMTIWTETRLDEEDVENVPNMATADMISLLLQTKFPEDRLIKWIDQAILLTYLGAAQKKKKSLLRSIFSRSPKTTADKEGPSSKTKDDQTDPSPKPKDDATSPSPKPKDGETDPSSTTRDDDEPLSSRTILANNGITTASELMVAYNAAAADPAEKAAFEGLLGPDHPYQIRHIVRYLQEQSTNFNLIAAWRGLVVDQPSRARASNEDCPVEQQAEVHVISGQKRQAQRTGGDRPSD